MKKAFILIILSILLTSCGTLKTADTNECNMKIRIISAHPRLQNIITANLTKKFPNVEFEIKSIDLEENYYEIIEKNCLSNTPPDIIIGKGTDLLYLADSGIIAPVDSGLKNSLTDTGIRYSQYKGELYAFPIDYNYLGVMYNKDIFSKYNLEIPKTIEELENTVNTLNKNNITPFASHFHETWSIGNTLMQFASNNVFNIYPYWGNELRNGNVTFKDSKEYRYCFEDLKYVYNNSWKDTLEIDLEEANKRFFKCNAAMYITGPWTLENSNKYNPDISLGIFPYPNRTGNSKLLLMPNILIMKTEASKNKNSADVVIKSFSEDPVFITEIIDYNQTLPLLKNINPSYYNPLKNDVESYIKSESVTSMLPGNEQINWNLQCEYSIATSHWLAGEITLEEVLEYSDENKNLSKFN